MRRLTVKSNSVAVVADGSAVLGIGNVGPYAALPVMEGKAALFKRFAGIDAWPICLDTQDTEEIVRCVQVIAPAFGGINLEDISAPRCFDVERRLRALLDIPVFHDDQHGTAIVVLAALTNALPVVATGRSDYPNQINNVLAFPGVFRGLLDAQSRTITEAMLIAAARALSEVVTPDELGPNYIVPSVFHPNVASAVAAAVRAAAEAEETADAKAAAAKVVSGPREATIGRDAAAGKASAGIAP